MTLIDVWINCPDDETADRIAEALLNARLIACANRFAPVQSQYVWDGEIVRESETPLLVKTQKHLFTALEHAVTGLHPYEIPPIVAIEATAVNQPYLDWLHEVTRSPGS